MEKRLIEEIKWCLESFVSYCDSEGILQDNRACQPKNEAIYLLEEIKKTEEKA